MSATVMLRSPEAAGYGRHAAPLSAYGPSDVCRLLPVPPMDAPVTEPAEAGDAPVEAIDSAVRPAVDAAGGDGSVARSSDDVRMKAKGFWARLRLLPKAA